MDGQETSLSSIEEMLDMGAVARLLKISTRNVHRLVDRGGIPQPIKVGRLNRWPPRCIREWIETGCKPPKA